MREKPKKTMPVVQCCNNVSCNWVIGYSTTDTYFCFVFFIVYLPLYFFVCVGQSYSELLSAWESPIVLLRGFSGTEN